MLEHFAGALPLWLAPEQVRLVPIADRHLDFAYEVKAQLEQGGGCVWKWIAAQKRSVIRSVRATLEKVPYMLTIGDKECEEKTVAVRRRNGEDLGSMTVDALQAMLVEEVDTKTKIIASEIRDPLFGLQSDPCTFARHGAHPMRCVVLFSVDDYDMRIILVK